MPDESDEITQEMHPAQDPASGEGAVVERAPKDVASEGVFPTLEPPDDLPAKDPDPLGGESTDVREMIRRLQRSIPPRDVD